MPQPRVLVVEDCEDLLAVTLIQLRLMGCAAVGATNASDAWQKARSEEFDLYILDDLLTDGSGSDLRQKLRNWTPAVPALFLTGRVFSEEHQESLWEAGDGYLLKPAYGESLEMKIALLVNQTNFASRQSHGKDTSGPVLSCSSPPRFTF